MFFSLVSDKHKVFHWLSRDLVPTMCIFTLRAKVWKTKCNFKLWIVKMWIWISKFLSFFLSRARACFFLYPPIKNSSINFRTRAGILWSYISGDLRYKWTIKFLTETKKYPKLFIFYPKIKFIFSVFTLWVSQKYFNE